MSENHENEFAQEKDKLGRPLWDKILHDLISCTYQVPKEVLTDRDIAIQCVLIALHEAVQGKSDLNQLAEGCVAYSRITTVLNTHHRN